tara:strand:- start:107 stop:265 length:159 start_codon:yes stop_codon:yes gene_type:complete
MIGGYSELVGGKRRRSRQSKNRQQGGKKSKSRSNKQTKRNRNGGKKRQTRKR